MAITPAKNQQPPKRRDVDWDAVERDYRTAKFTLRELAIKYGVTHQAVAKQAKTKGWTQDLSKAIKQATNAKLVAELVDKEVAAGGQAVANTVLAVAELNKQVILGHRKHAQDASAALAMARDRLGEIVDSVTDVREFGALASAVESLSRTAKNVIDIERKAYGLDDQPPEPPDESLSDDELDRRIAAKLAQQ